MSSDEWLFDLMKQYWMDPCTAVVRPYSPAELQAHNLCAPVPPMIFMFALVGLGSLMAYLNRAASSEAAAAEAEEIMSFATLYISRVEAHPSSISTGRSAAAASACALTAATQSSASAASSTPKR